MGIVIYAPYRGKGCAVPTLKPMLGHAMLAEALRQIGDGTVFLWAFRENKRARRFYEKHGFRWDGTERISEFDGAMEVRYVRK